MKTGMWKGMWKAMWKGMWNSHGRQAEISGQYNGCLPCMKILEVQVRGTIQDHKRGSCTTPGLNTETCAITHACLVAKLFICHNK